MTCNGRFKHKFYFLFQIQIYNVYHKNPKRPDNDKPKNYYLSILNKNNKIIIFQ